MDIQQNTEKHRAPRTDMTFNLFKKTPKTRKKHADWSNGKHLDAHNSPNERHDKTFLHAFLVLTKMTISWNIIENRGLYRLSVDFTYYICNALMKQIISLQVDWKK